MAFGKTCTIALRLFYACNEAGRLTLIRCYVPKLRDVGEAEPTSQSRMICFEMLCKEKIGIKYTSCVIGRTISP